MTCELCAKAPAEEGERYCRDCLIAIDEENGCGPDDPDYERGLPGPEVWPNGR